MPNSSVGASAQYQEQMFTLVKAGLSSIGFAVAISSGSAEMAAAAGGFTSAVLGDWWASRTHESVKQMLNFLHQDVERLKGDIHADSILKDEFFELFNAALSMSSRTGREEKLRACAAILANSLLPPKDVRRLKFNELDYLLRCVQELSAGAIHVIGIAHQIAGGEDTVAHADVAARCPEQDPEFIRTLLHELASRQLLRIPTVAWGNFEYDDKPVKRFHLTALGRRFVNELLLAHEVLRRDAAGSVASSINCTGDQSDSGATKV